MINIISLWKNIKIIVEFFYIEIKEDITKIFNVAPYTSFLYDILLSFKRLFLTPTYQVYWSILFLVVAIARFHWIIQILAFIIFCYTYFYRKIWKSGEPLKLYKDRYYSKEITTTFRKI